MQKIKLIVFVLLTGAFAWYIGFPHGATPPLGKMLDPFYGVWQNAESESADRGGEMDLPGLMAPAKVWYDDRLVPHIFAGNNHDLYYLQGFVTARDRLFQMEMQVRSAAGRLSEVVEGPSEEAKATLLNRDRMMRRMGLLWSAERSLELIQQDKESMEVMQAYADGVNAYVHSLGYASYPMEYKILNFEPAEWTPLESILLLKMMALRLTGRTEDMQQTVAWHIFGDSTYHQLFPSRPDSNDYPIVHPDSGWQFIPSRPDTPVHFPRPDGILPNLQYPEIHKNNGSNNWAVSGSRTKTGYPMLANDPHLPLSLPSIWYEIQLHSPEQNTYGVSLPGAPTVIIGFNEQVAWGVTNGSRDVIDWYRVEYTDASESAYKYGSGEEKTSLRVEEIKMKNGDIFMDTVRYTRHGPVMYDNRFHPNAKAPVNVAMRWTAHDPSNELRTFLELNQAKSYEDYRSAIQHFHTPAQNFVYADRANNIAITHQGKFPLRFEGQGDFVMEGKDPASEWQGFVPMDQNPSEKNPGRGYVFSANQFPADADYPYSQTGHYEPFRHIRLNQLLSEAEQATPETMKAIQLDILNLSAKRSLPALMATVQRDKLDEEQHALLQEMANWNYMNHADSVSPTLFSLWISELYEAIYRDELSSYRDPVTGDTLVAAQPSWSTALRLVMENPDHPVVDNIQTPQRESLADLVTTSWARAAERAKAFEQQRGSLRWAVYNDLHIMHIAQIPSFSRFDIPASGGANILNASHGIHGPSWRMVVSLGKKDGRGIEAWGIYPGGQSGNPASYWYDNSIDDWTEGQYYKLKFLTEAPSGEAWQELTLNPSGQ